MSARIPAEHNRRRPRSRARGRRFYVGWRERFSLVPHFLWLNFSKSGISLTVHVWIASWNTRTGWYFHGPLGFYLRERRGWGGTATRQPRGPRATRT